MRDSIRNDVIRPFLKCTGIDIHLFRIVGLQVIIKKIIQGNNDMQGIFVVGEGETKTVKLEKYHADLADMLDNFTLDEFKVSDENGNTVKGSELTKNPAVLMWLEQGKEPTEHILNEMLEQEADFQNLPADIIFMVKDKAALENAKLTKVLSTFPRIRVLYDTFVPNVETLARRMYVDPEKLPLIIVTTKELNAVYACSGYNVGSGDMLVKICRNFAGK